MIDIKKQETLDSTEICDIMGVSYLTIMKYVKRGKFPQPLPMPYKRKYWSKSEVIECINKMYKNN